MVYLKGPAAGGSDLILDYYENGGGNQVSFSITPFDANSNTIVAPTPSSVCSNTQPNTIDGSSYLYNGSSVNPTIKYQWQRATNANGPWLDVAGETNEDYRPAAITTTTPVVNYYRRVVSAAASNASACTWNSNVISITTGASGPMTVPVANAATAVTCSSFTASWSSIASASSYRIDVATSNSFTTGSILPAYNNLDLGLVTSFNVTGLSTTNTTYYYRIRAYNVCGNATTAPSTSITVGMTSPTVTIGGTTTVCQNATSPSVSFTNSQNSAITVTYNINGGTNTTLNVPANSVVYVVAPTTASGTFAYNLVSAVYQAVPTCSQNLTGSATITVNPVHTITAGSNQTVCQNNTMTNITMTLGGGATGATVTGLPAGVTYSVSGTTLTISGAPTVSGQFTYNVTTTGNSCTVATTSGVITVGVGNNTISYSNGTSGSVCGSAAENGVVNFIAPAGTYFNAVRFASYGLPVGTTCGAYSIGSCHSNTSQSVTEGFLLGNSNTVSFSASNGNFGDPCYNTVKNYRGYASYSMPICSGTAPGTISGSDPTGSGTYNYQWQSSTAATGPFASITGANDKDYTPGALTVSTYFRRVVTSGTCTNTSAIVLIKVNPLPTIATAATTSAVCYGATNATLAYTGTTGTPTTYSITWNTSPANTFASVTDASLPASPISITIPSTAAANTYTGTITVKNANGCVSTGNSFTLTVRPQFTAGEIQTTGQTICAGETPTQIGSTTAASGGNGVITYQWTANGVNITSANGSTYTPPAGLNTTTTYTRLASDGTCNTTPTAATGSWVVTVRQIENAPTPGATTNVTCLNQGTVVLSNLPTGAWQINQTGPGTATSSFTGTGTPYTVTGLAAGAYKFSVQTATTCVSAETTPVTITDQSSTTWNGSGWSHGDPDLTKSVIIASTAGNPFAADIEACSLTISVPNATGDPVVTVPEGITLTITNAVTSNGKLVFENNASLVQTTNAVNTGEIVYKRKASLRRYDATYWSMPVTKSGFQMSDFSPNTLSDKYFIFDPNTAKWAEVPNGNLPMEKGKGYNIRAPQTHPVDTPAEFTGIFTGIPNNGDFNLSVDSGKWYLIGNPYPSAVNAVQFLTDNSGMGALYFWEHKSLPILFPDGKYYYMDDYLVVNSLGSNGFFDGNIAAAQGFLVKAGSTTINFRNNRRVKGNNSQFFKTAGSEIERHRLWVNLKNDSGVSKQILLGYATGATNTTDADFDALTMGSTTEFYSINNAKKLTIQGRALPFDKSDLVPLGIKLPAEGSYTITIDHADGFFNDGQDVFLEDKTTGKITNLRTSDYTFTSAAGSFNSRFVISYTNKTLGTDDFENLENGVLVSVKDKVVKITSSKESIKQVTIFNIGAQLIYNKNNVNSSELQISNLNSSDQALLVKITLENGHTFTKKIIYSTL